MPKIKMEGKVFVMEEFNKDLNNEPENEVAEETVETIETVVEDAPVEEDFDFAPEAVEKCCCTENTKKKISVTGIILYAFGALSIVFGIVNLISTLSTIKQMYGSLQPLDFYTTLSIITPLMTSAMLGIVAIGIGRLLFMVKNK